MASGLVEKLGKGWCRALQTRILVERNDYVVVNKPAGVHCKSASVIEEDDACLLSVEEASVAPLMYAAGSADVVLSRGPSTLHG